MAQNDILKEGCSLDHPKAWEGLGEWGLEGWQLDLVGAPKTGKKAKSSRAFFQWPNKGRGAFKSDPLWKGKFKKNGPPTIQLSVTLHSGGKITNGSRILTAHRGGGTGRVSNFLGAVI